MPDTRTNSDSLLRWIIAASIYFVCLIAFYIDIGEDMGAEYFMPILLPVIGALIALQYATRVPLLSRAMIPNLLSAIGWASAFPLLYAWTYSSVWYQSLICFDFIVGTAALILITSLESACYHIGHVRIFAALATLLNFIALFVPFLEYAYYCLVWHCLTPASLMAVYLTNYKESLDFIQSNVGVLPACLILAGIAVLLYAAYCCHLAIARTVTDDGPTAGRMGVLAALVIGSIYALYYYLPLTSMAEQWNDVSTYVEQTQEYGVGHDERLDDLAIDTYEALPAKAPGTVILVIGESASRDYMHAYTPSFPYEDTPWLDEKLSQPDSGFISFQNAYSSWSQTVPVLQRALTEQSQYNGKEFYDSTSIIDVAHKAGYETWWFSNQGRYGQFDSAITLVARTADHAEWTDDSYNFSDKYDGTLLSYLTALDPNKDNFVVLHIMGSHIYYNNRYPSEFNVFTTPEGESTVSSTESYANSILYTDYILSQVFEYAQKNLNLQAMFYMSDHGENLQISHNPDVFSYDMVRIPMFVYLSPSYRSVLPGRTSVLESHRSRYFTNDMLYDTICGILNAPSNHYFATQDFSSPAYAYNRSNLTTMLGQQTLIDDPNGGEEQ